MEQNTLNQSKRVGLFRKSWTLTKASVTALKLDKELLVLPVIGFVYSTVLLLPFIALYVFNPNNLLYVYTKQVAGTSTTIDFHFEPLGYLLMVLLFIASTIISAYIAGATIAGALERFRGGDPTVKSALAASRKKLKPLAIFATFSFLVGYILNFIAERVPFAAKLLVWLASMAWGIASFFSIPVIVDSENDLGPIEATKKSMELIKKTWGESLIASASIGIIALLVTMSYLTISLSASLLTFFGVGSVILGIIVSSIFFIGLIVLSLVFSMLSGYVRAAVYYYATTGQSPLSFNKQLLEQAFTVKKAKKIFGA